MPRTNIVFFRLALVLALIVVTWLATTPIEYPPVESINDKAAHILAFCVLALLGDFSFPDGHYDLSKIAPLLGYGLLIEIIQYFLPYRTCSFLDLVADGIGIALYGFSLPALKHAPLLRQRWHTGV
ncbi:MAG: VanZ family protein [Gammaproteobacteria bacterium]